jgi:hypothetical protein
VDWLEIAVLAEDEAVDAVAEVLRAHGRGVRSTSHSSNLALTRSRGTIQPGVRS